MTPFSLDLSTREGCCSTLERTGTAFDPEIIVEKTNIYSQRLPRINIMQQAVQYLKVFVRPYLVLQLGRTFLISPFLPLEEQCET